MKSVKGFLLRSEIGVKGIFMSDYEMNDNRGYGSDYQPVIDRLREIAQSHYAIFFNLFKKRSE